MSQIYKTQTGGGGGGTVVTLEGNDLVKVSPDAFGNINVLGDATYLTVTGNVGTHTETISPINRLTVVFRSPLIDFTVVASTLAYNIPHDFVITGITVFGVSGVGSTGFQFELDNPGSIFQMSAGVVTAGSTETSQNGGASNVVLANTNVFVNVTNGDGGSPVTGYIFITGFYP